MTDSYGSYQQDGKNYMQWIGEYLGMTENTNFWQYDFPGVGMKQELEYGCFGDKVLLLNNIPEPNNISDIYVFCGANDINTGNYDKIEAGIEYFAANAKSKFPNANLYLGLLSWSCAPATITQTPKVAIEYAKANRHGVKFLENMEFIMCEINYFQTDGTHPALNHLKDIANFCIPFIVNGYSDIKRTISCTFSTSETGITIARGSFTMSQMNNVVTINSGYYGGIILDVFMGGQVQTKSFEMTLNNSLLFYNNKGKIISVSGQLVEQSNAQYLGIINLNVKNYTQSEFNPNAQTIAVSLQNSDGDTKYFSRAYIQGGMANNLFD